MGTRYSEADRDVVKTLITEAAQDMTAAIAEAAGALSISVGTNVLTGVKRFEVDRAIQQISDVLREAQFPEGPGATTYAYLASLPGVKSQVVVGNGANLPALTVTEDAVVVSYNAFHGTSQGGSHPYQVAISKIRNHIRESLAAA